MARPTKPPRLKAKGRTRLIGLAVKADIKNLAVVSTAEGQRFTIQPASTVG